MTLTNCYAEVKDLQKRLGREEDPQDKDVAIMEQAITAASRYIDAETRSFFYTKTLTNELVDMKSVSASGLKMGKDSIIFPAPIIAITKVEERTANDGGYQEITVDDDYYVYHMKIMRDGSWPTCFKAVRITGSMGLAATPERIKLLCLDIAEVFCGLGTNLYVDEQGQQMPVMRNYLPVRVLDRLDAERIGRVGAA